MAERTFIVVGGTGLIGSAVVGHLRGRGHEVLALDSTTYASAAGASADVLVNCDGNTFRYKANQDPRWDFDASVLSVENTLFDFRFGLYVYVSTVDVYNHLDDPARNREGDPIDPAGLDAYGFHKWLAERLVERFAPRSVVFRAGTVIGPGLKKGPLFDLLNDRPLFMSPESTLSLVDTATVAAAVAAVAGSGPGPARSVVNLTGTGPARLADLAGLAGRPVRAADGGGAKVYRYHINNTKLRELMPVPTSAEAAARFIAGFRKEPQ